MRVSRSVAFLVVLMMVAQPLLVILPASLAEGEGGDRAETDLVVTKSHVVTTSQEWRHVKVGHTGTLVIKAEGSMIAQGLTLEGGSRLSINGGMLIITNPEDDLGSSLTGTCLELVMTNGAILIVEGGRGQGSARGGDALVDVAANHRVLIDRSSILVSGGQGVSPDGPMTFADLSDDEFMGGSAHLSISVVPSPSGLNIARSSIKVIGGNGGDAPDGGSSEGPAGGAAGGFAAGGPVSGRVAMGGASSADLNASPLHVVSSLIEVMGGNGGNAGDGGDSSGTGGGGGGGYSGGDGGDWPDGRGVDGGRVSGRVGMGGDASLSMNTMDLLDITGSRAVVDAGDGGRAGDGGNGDMPLSEGYSGGAGGGGYSGGGGGASGDPKGNDGGDGNNVSGLVGAGGAASIRFEAPASTVSGTQMSVTGGEGGRGGTPGASTRVNDYWDWSAGGGGGSYSAGGGGGTNSSSWSSGNGGAARGVSGLVASGGDAILDLDLVDPVIPVNTTLETVEGAGGVCWRADAPGAAGGNGDGLITTNGYSFEHVPMSRVELISPDPGEVSSKVPVFRWARARSATSEGRVVGYEFQLDDDPTFGSPEMSFNINSDFVAPSWLPNFTNYWRVRALYARPWNAPGPWSASRSITYINLPPVIGDIPVIEVMVSIVTTIDLTEYITDSDDLVGHLSLTSDHPNVLRTSNLNITLQFPKELGTVPLNFTVTDSLNHVEGQVMIRVTRYRHSPYILGITNHKLPLELNLLEGTETWFEIFVHDVDSDEFSYWTTGSWEGARAFPNGTLRVRGQRGDVGVHEFRLNVADEGDRLASARVYVNVINVNDPPDPPGIVSPSNSVRVRVGEIVSFMAVVSDPDVPYGQLLNVTFISNDTGVLRTMQTTTTAEMSSSSLPVGRHVVTVLVSDGQYSSSDQVVVIVEAPPEAQPVTPPPTRGPNMWVYIVASIVLFAVGFVAGNVRMRRAKKDGPEY
jgi:hypothetical protein